MTFLWLNSIYAHLQPLARIKPTHCYIAAEIDRVTQTNYFAYNATFF